MGLEKRCLGGGAWDLMGIYILGGEVGPERESLASGLGIQGDPGTISQDWEKRLRPRFCKESDKSRHSKRKVFFFLLGSSRILLILRSVLFLCLF